MGFFNRDESKERIEETKPEEEDKVECNDCGKEFLESELNDDGICKECAVKMETDKKTKKEKKDKLNYTLTVEFYGDSDVEAKDAYERTHISQADAKEVYDLVSQAVMVDKKYVMIKEMDSLDDDGNEATYNPETIYIDNVDRVTYAVDEDYEEEEEET